MIYPVHIAPPCVLVLLGTGDLVKRKLMPALFNLHQANRLPDAFAILACGLDQWDEDVFRDTMLNSCKEALQADLHEADWLVFASRLHYQPSNFSEAEAYLRIRERLAEIDAAADTHGNRLFFMATFPSLYETIVSHLGTAGLSNREADGPFTRLMVEKPFGSDLDSASALNVTLHGVFKKKQIFLIDHYLGKETVQNLLVLRFANSIFEPLWTRQHIDYVEIHAAETIGVGRRGAYYEEAGILRDMVQNHLLELLSLVAMEPPLSFTADDVRDKKLEVLRALRPIRGEQALQDVVLGQYGPSPDGQNPGYRAEPGVAQNSRTPTFAAIRVFVDNWRWQGVPFYLRTGKRLSGQRTEVVVHFLPVPYSLFGTETGTSKIQANRLILSIQPTESVQLVFGAKVPGTTLQVQQARMHFGFEGEFTEQTHSPYERLLLDALRGDQLLFARADGIEAAWNFVDPIIEAWRDVELPEPFPNYFGGSDGPLSANQLIRDRRNR
ncbi:MAG: glucose-6-phosphate dehydrogenase [Sulfuriferula sp.]